MTTERRRRTGNGMKETDAVFGVHLVFTERYGDGRSWVWIPELNIRSCGEDRAQALAHLFNELHQLYKDRTDQVGVLWNEAFGKNVVRLLDPADKPTGIQGFEVPDIPGDNRIH